MKFTKMQGAGNDFILLNNIVEKLPTSVFPTIARRLCSRRLSIGADGLIVIEKPQNGGDFRMLFFNADGSLGEMCGNGARCLCRYGYENGLAGEIQRVETTAGLVTGRRESERIYTIRLNDPSVIRPDYPVVCDGATYECAYLELGDPGLPHAVVPLPDVDAAASDELRRIGSLLRHHQAFPKGANVNFCTLTEKNTIRVRTFERGVEDLTQACGTGAGSVATAYTLRGKVSGEKVRILMDGGELFVSLKAEGEKVTGLFLTGPTNIVAEGEVRDEELYY